MGLGIRLLMFVLVAFLPVSPCWAQQADTASPQHRVLFLHSYSPEFSWVRDIPPHTPRLSIKLSIADVLPEEARRALGTP